MRLRNSRANNGYVGGAKYPLRYTDGYGVLTPNKCHVLETEIQDWNRPSDWIPIPEGSYPDGRFMGLVSIFQGASGNTGATADSNFVALRCVGTGNYIVDWGFTTAANPNGVTTSHTSNTTAFRQYNWADIPASSITADGFKQVLVQAYPVTGTTFTQVNLNLTYSSGGVSIPFTRTTQWIDIAIHGISLTSFIFGGQSFTGNNATRHYAVKRVSIVGPTRISGALGMFSPCMGLERVAGTDWCGPLFTDGRQVFMGAINIRSFPLWKAQNMTNMTGFAADAKGMVKFPAIHTSKVTLFSQLFQESVGVVDAPMPSVAPGGVVHILPMLNTALVTAWDSSFNRQRCIRELPPWSFASATNLASMFSSCGALEGIRYINAPNCTNASNLFNSCFRLTRIDGLTFAATVNCQNLFASCFSLRVAPRIQTPTGGITLSGTDFTGMYSNCTDLVNVPAYSFSAAGAAYNTMFSGCNALTHLPEGFKFPDNMSGLTQASSGPLHNTFSGLTELRRATLVNPRRSFSYSLSTSTFNTLSATELNRIFTNLGGVTSVGTCTINITNNWGAAFCDRTIATAKGWTVTG